MPEKEPETHGQPSLVSIFTAFLRLGLTAFGGPAMVPYIRDMAVRRKAWLSEDLFRLGMAVCQSVPGATAMQAAAYVGLRCRGVAGALAAYLGFGLPAFVLIVVLSVLYAHSLDVKPVLAAFEGLKIVVVALIANAAVNFSRKYLTRAADKLLALAAGVILGLEGNPILAILGVCVAGVFIYREYPGGQGPARAQGQAPVSYRPLRTLALLCLAVGFALAVLFLLDRFLFELAMVMIKVDLFAFGGAYVSLPIMLHEVTTARAWMTPEVFMDGIALGQVTPGPILMTAGFVGYVVKGLLGALVGAVAAFTPSFLILTAAVPYFDRLQSSFVFKRALRAGLASLVGLMAAIAGRFFLVVDWDVYGACLALAAFTALRLKIDILWVVLGGAALAALFLQ